jgi:hypothetical protein
MIANVKNIVTRDFVPLPTEAYSAEVANGVFSSIETSINGILQKIRDRGFYMDNIALDRIDNITQFTSVMNSNIDKINLYLSSINQALATNYLLGKEILETMKIDVLNADGASSIVVYDDRIDIAMANSQVVSVSQDKVISTKGSDIQEITHA